MFIEITFWFISGGVSLCPAPVLKKFDLPPINNIMVTDVRETNSQCIGHICGIKKYN